jgi:toxin ParE1/3/4
VNRFRLTPPAERDLESIADFTVSRWGRAQAIKYVAALQARFQWLADNPLLGRDRSEVVEGYRSFRQGSHLIFYKVTGDEIVILGVPHASMDIEGYFGE